MVTIGCFLFTLSEEDVFSVLLCSKNALDLLMVQLGRLHIVGEVVIFDLVPLHELVIHELHLFLILIKLLLSHLLRLWHLFLDQISDPLGFFTRVI